MNLAHIHIVLNHVPSLGSIVALTLLAASIYTKNEGLKKFSFLGLVLIAMAVLPTYITGAESQRVVRNLPAVSRAMIQLHQNAAMVTLLAMTFTGTLAWFGLWEIRRFTRAGALTTIGTLLLASFTCVSILYTASIGGKISHPEIREGAETTMTDAPAWRDKVENFVNDSGWAWPSLETLHYIGMISLFGIALVVLLRMFGMMGSIPFSGIHRLLPLAVIGFLLNVLTGMTFFIGSPGLYLGKTSYHIKMASIVLAALPLLYFTVSDRSWHTGSNGTASVVSKLAAVGFFGLLLAVLIYGRLLPFLH